MVKILVGSKNPVKLESVREAFSYYFKDLEVMGLSVDSRVPDQPVNDKTFTGAHNRALALQKINQDKHMGASFCVGIEGGIINLYSKWFAFGVICIVDDTGKFGFGISPNFEISNHHAEELLQGTELGDIADRITGGNNVKQKGGIISFLTKGIISRKDLYVPGVVAALIPLLNKDIYFK